MGEHNSLADTLSHVVGAKLLDKLTPGIGMSDIPVISHPSSDPEFINELADDRAKGGNWIHRAFGSIGSWFKNNKGLLRDIGMNVLSSLPALLLEGEGDLYVDATHLHRILKNVTAGLSAYESYDEVSQVLAPLELMLEQLGNTRGIVPAKSIF